MGRRFLSESTLSNSRLASEREQAPATSCCSIDSNADFRELVPPTNEGLSAAVVVQLAHVHSIRARTTSLFILTNFSTDR
jgi:hypothetical protein